MAGAPAARRKLSRRKRRLQFLMRHNPARLAALQRLMILDSATERDDDAIPGLLAQSLGVPIAMVNRLHSERAAAKAAPKLVVR